MASPQPDKHTRFSNELLQEIYRRSFSGAQLRVLLAIARNSYGWQRKKTTQMGYKRMANETEMPRGSVKSAITLLLKHGVVVKHADGIWGINKDYDSWLDGGRPITPGGGEPSPPKGATHHPRGGERLTAYKEKEKQKERKKDVLQKLAPTPPKKLTPQQVIVRYFKEAKGFDADDTDWNRRNFNGRLMKEAAVLLKAFDGDPIKAGRYMLIKGEEWKDLQDWTMNAIAAAAGRDPRINGEHGEEHEREARTMDADCSHGPRRVTGTSSARDLVSNSLAGLREQAALPSPKTGDLAGPGDDLSGNGQD